ncbi:hypothetical protein CK203_026843 [Vitis vinifera]|uniref:DUF4283 domain-containing protein n=1 Tax=Vitis vinifera TaxID=29760 RepID=A0A438INZ9_VITVI|nr:hypothetical protein CK203_026843 [Vitis vinifera]
MVLQEGEDFLRWKERILKSVLKAFMEGSGFPSLQLVELKNAESSESSLDFNSKFRRKSRTHLLEVTRGNANGEVTGQQSIWLQVQGQYKGLVRSWKGYCKISGLKGMVSVSPFFFFKGLCFVDSVGRAHCLQKLGIVPMKEGAVISLRRWSPRKNMVVLRKFKAMLDKVAVPSIPFMVAKSNHLDRVTSSKQGTLMEERERERAVERERVGSGGDPVELCASDGVINFSSLDARTSRWKRSFEVESKTFEIELERKKGKTQIFIEERKRGVSSWIKMVRRA